MRVLIWGIVALFGFAVAVAAISVHGSKDEHAAIRRAVRAPFADLHRRDALRLCDDFIASVDRSLAPGSGDCQTRVAHAFALARSSVVRLQADEPQSPGRLRVTGISWSGDRASAVSSLPGTARDTRAWRLRRVDDVWRIATPVRLVLPAAKTRHPRPRAPGARA